MTWKDSVTPAEAVDLLNDLMRRDPAAMRELFRWRVTCNTELALHPGVQVDATDVLSDEPIQYSVGLLGILNTLFGLDEGKRGLIREVRGLASGLQRFTLALEYASTPPEQEPREQLLARLEAVEAKVAVIGGEACIENRKAGRGPCGACAVCCAELRKELEEVRVAQQDTLKKLEAKAANAQYELRTRIESLRVQLGQEVDARKAAQERGGQRVRRIAELEEKLASLTPHSTEYDAKHLTPAQFMELAQIFFSRRSVWTEDDAWVREHLSYVAHYTPGKFVGEGTARRMCEMALNPTSPSPAQRAKMEGDGRAKFLDVWLRELGEGREWLGCAGGPAFGPVRPAIDPLGHRNWEARTFRAEYEFSAAQPMPTRVRTHDRDCLCQWCLDEVGRSR